MSIADRYRRVVDRVAAAAIRAGRSPGEISIVAAAKTFGPGDVMAAVAAGVRHVGENYVQEARAKRAAVGRADVRWHLIGRLQRNKAKAAVATFDCIESLDSVELASALDRAARSRGISLRCLIEVNLGAEPAKGGVRPEHAGELVEAASRLTGLSIEGLMAIPPPGESPDDSRPHFTRLRELLHELSRLRLPGVHLKELSMGMSADYEAAVEEGATIVRIGTAIFGPRRVKG